MSVLPREPAAYRAGFAGGERLAGTSNAADTLWALGLRALDDVLNEDAPGPLRWRAGAFLLGLCKGYAGD